jgi:hypothetical protein
MGSVSRPNLPVTPQPARKPTNNEIKKTVVDSGLANTVPADVTKPPSTDLRAKPDDNAWGQTSMGPTGMKTEAGVKYYFYPKDSNQKLGTDEYRNPNFIGAGATVDHETGKASGNIYGGKQVTDISDFNSTEVFAGLSLDPAKKKTWDAVTDRTYSQTIGTLTNQNGAELFRTDTGLQQTSERSYNENKRVEDNGQEPNLYVGAKHTNASARIKFDAVPEKDQYLVKEYADDPRFEAQGGAYIGLKSGNIGVGGKAKFDFPLNPDARFSPTAPKVFAGVNEFSINATTKEQDNGRNVSGRVRVGPSVEIPLGANGAVKAEGGWEQNFTGPSGVYGQVGIQFNH